MQHPDIDDLYRLVLADGLKATAAGKDIAYRTVHLREVTVADERWAQRQAERAVMVGGSYRLLVSDADFRFALTARHIDSLRCDDSVIPQALIDLELLGKLTPHDLGLIEARIVLITLAAELRYGHITEADFAAAVDGMAPRAQQAPQPPGQVAPVGSADPVAQPGPALLADYVGAATNPPASGAGA